MPRFYDGDWYLISHDMQLKRTTWGRDNPDGSTTVRTDYEVDATVEANKAQRNMAQSNWAGDYHRIASIPLNVYHAELAEAVKQDDMRYFSKWLNDGDNLAWRTKEGRV